MSRTTGAWVLVVSLAMGLIALAAPAAAAPARGPSPQDFVVGFSYAGMILPNGTIPEFDSVLLECSASGGVGPFTWVWDFGDGTNETVSGVNSVYAVTNHTFGQVGAFNVRCNGTDSLGAHGSANGTVRTSFWPFVTATVVFSPTPSVLQGYVLSIRADAIYGYGPSNFTWSGLPPGCAAPPPQEAGRFLCTPTAPGTYNVSVAVTDSVTNHTARAYAVLLVSPAFLGMTEPQGFGVLALVLLLAVVSELLARLRLSTPPPRSDRRNRTGWVLAAAGGVLGLASLALPWMYVALPTGSGGAIAGTVAPIQLFLNTPAASFPAGMLGGYPFYPDSIRTELASQIVGALIFVAGCLLALLRRVHGAWLMALGLAVAFVAIPGSWAPTWGVGTGWGLGILAALIALGGYFSWYPPGGRWPPITPVPMTGPMPEETARNERPPPGP